MRGVEAGVRHQGLRALAIVSSVPVSTGKSGLRKRSRPINAFSACLLKNQGFATSLGGGSAFSQLTRTGSSPASSQRAFIPSG